MPERTSKLHFVDQLPPAKRFGSETLLIYDRRLANFVPGFSKWAKPFSAAYAVASGESL